MRKQAQRGSTVNKQGRCLVGDLTTRSSCLLGLDSSGSEGHSHTPMIMAGIEGKAELGG